MGVGGASPRRSTDGGARRESAVRTVMVLGADGGAGQELASRIAARGLVVHGAADRPIALADVPCHVLPQAEDPHYLPALTRLLRDTRADVLISCDAGALPTIAAGRAALTPGLEVAIAGAGPVAIASDRLYLAARLLSRGVPVAAFGVPSDFVDFDTALERMGGCLTLRPRRRTIPDLVRYAVATDPLDWSAEGDDQLVQQCTPGETYVVVVHRPATGDRGRVTAAVKTLPSDHEHGGPAVVPAGSAAGAERLAQAGVRALGLTGPAEVQIGTTHEGRLVVLDILAGIGPVGSRTPALIDALVGATATRDPRPAGRASRTGGVR